MIRWRTIWQRWGWSGLSGLFALCCLAAGWWASRGLDTQIRMAFLVLSAAFFLFGFLHYFFAVADFSPTQRRAERERLHQPPPRKRWLVVYLLVGISCIAGLVALWWWRYGAIT